MNKGAPMLPARFIAMPRSIFLIDGLGAFLSGLLLLLLAYFEDVFGMPQPVLYRLLPITALFTVYSLGCYALNPSRWPRYLVAIAVANLLYACLTGVLLVYYFTRLTTLGITYFLVEIVVIGFLAGFELWLAYRAWEQTRYS